MTCVIDSKKDERHKSKIRCSVLRIMMIQMDSLHMECRQLTCCCVKNNRSTTAFDTTREITTDSHRSHFDALILSCGFGEDYAICQYIVVDGTHLAVNDRSWPRCDDHVHRRSGSVWSDLQKRHAGSLLQMDGGGSDHPFCEDVLRCPINTFVGGGDGHHTEHPTRGSRGARWPPHANAPRIGATRLIGCHPRGDDWQRESVRQPRWCPPRERTWEGGANAVYCQRRTSQPRPHWSAPWQNPGLELFRSGVLPSGIEALTRAARVVKPDAVVWKGDPNLPPTQQGWRCWASLSASQHTSARARNKQCCLRRSHGWMTLKQLGSCWWCAPRPGPTFGCAQFGQSWPKRSPLATTPTCGIVCCTILGTPRAPPSWVLWSLALSAGLGLVSAHRARVCAHWASWADCFFFFLTQGKFSPTFSLSGTKKKKTKPHWEKAGSTESQPRIPVVTVHLMWCWGATIPTMRVLQIQQRRGHCSRSRASQHASPSHPPRLLGPFSHQRKFTACWCDSWRAQKPSSLLGPTAPNFHSNNDELRTPLRTHQLGVLCANATPSVVAAPCLGTPSRCNAQTKVVSIATWAPPRTGSPSTTTSNRRLSWALGAGTSMSRTIKFVRTLPPASLEIRAIMLSKANPRRPNTPACAQTARWWPQRSSGWPHRQLCTMRGRARRRRRKNTTRNRWDGIVVSLLIGATDKAAAAPRPACDLIRAWDCSRHPGKQTCSELALCTHAGFLLSTTVTSPWFSFLGFSAWWSCTLCKISPTRPYTGTQPTSMEWLEPRWIPWPTRPPRLGADCESSTNYRPNWPNTLACVPWLRSTTQCLPKSKVTWPHPSHLTFGLAKSATWCIDTSTGLRHVSDKNPLKHRVPPPLPHNWREQRHNAREATTMTVNRLPWGFSPAMFDHPFATDGTARTPDPQWSLTPSCLVCVPATRIPATLWLIASWWWGEGTLFSLKRGFTTSHTEMHHVSWQWRGVSKNWQMQVWRCLLGGNCQILLQSSTMNQSPTSPRWGGNRRQPDKPNTSSSVTQCGLGWMIPTELSSGPSMDRWRQFRSLHFPRPGWRKLTPNLSAFFAEGCISPFLWLCAPADVAANLTRLAIIVQCAPRRGFWDAVDVLWRWPQLRSAGRPELACPQTSSWELDLAAFNVLGRQKTPGCGRRVDLVPRCPTRHWHHHGVSIALWRFRKEECRCWRRGVGSSKDAARRGPTPGWWKGPTGGVGCRSGWVEHGDRPVPLPPGQSTRVVRSSGSARSGPGGVDPPVERHPRLQCGPGIFFVLVGPAPVSTGVRNSLSSRSAAGWPVHVGTGLWSCSGSVASVVSVRALTDVSGGSLPAFAKKKKKKFQSDIINCKRIRIDTFESNLIKELCRYDSHFELKKKTED